MTQFEEMLKKAEAAKADLFSDTKLTSDRLALIAERVLGEREDPCWIFELHNAEMVGDKALFAGYLIDMNDNTDDDVALRVLLSKSDLLYEATGPNGTFTGEFINGCVDSPDNGEDV